jgi:hypothetical protein
MVEINGFGSKSISVPIKPLRTEVHLAKGQFLLEEQPLHMITWSSVKERLYAYIDS